MSKTEISLFVYCLFIVLICMFIIFCIRHFRRWYKKQKLELYSVINASNSSSFSVSLPIELKSELEKVSDGKMTLYVTRAIIEKMERDNNKKGS